MATPKQTAQQLMEHLPELASRSHGMYALCEAEDRGTS